MSTPIMYTVQEVCDKLAVYCAENNIKNIFLVAGNSLEKMSIQKPLYCELKKKEINIVRFLDFEQNPRVESAQKAIELYKANSCDMILAIGGGSAIDVAKCVKMFLNTTGKIDLNKEILLTKIDLIAIPTTAGSGSEVTRYAVIYENGEKKSVTSTHCIPNKVFYVPSLLNSLPEYIKKSAMLDALCHSIESFWSVNSTKESQEFAQKAIELILNSSSAYIVGDDKATENVMYAAHLAGLAINITQTTAGHAMAYKLTSTYKIAHGHAVATCIAPLMRYMLQNTDGCIDSRGQSYVETMFSELASLFSASKTSELPEKFMLFVNSLELPHVVVEEKDLNELVKCVNIQRLKNNPIKLDANAIKELYQDI